MLRWRGLKFCAARVPWERDDIADIGHPGQELNRSLEAESKSAVGNGTEAAKIEVPPVIFFGEVEICESFLEEVQSFFALTTADDFTDARYEHIHGANGFAVVIASHVKGFDGGGIIEEDHGALNVLFGKESLVFGLQIDAPFDWILKGLSRFLENGDGFGIRDMGKRFFEH